MHIYDVQSKGEGKKEGRKGGGEEGEKKGGRGHRVEDASTSIRKVSLMKDGCAPRALGARGIFCSRFVGLEVNWKETVRGVNLLAW